MNRIYREFLVSLEESGIRYAILRDDLSSENFIKDLDLLVDPKVRTQFELIIEKHGFYLIKDGFFNPGKRVYFKKTVESERAYILDVHEKLIYRGLEFMNSKQVLERIHKKNGFFYLSHEDALLSLIFHNILAKKRIQKKHQKKISYLQNKQLDHNYLYLHLRSFGLDSIFQEISMKYSFACENESFVKILSKKAVRTLIRRPSNFFRVLKIYLRRHRSKFWGKSQGVILVFLGPDGAGKSTTVAAIKTRLEEFGFNCNETYLGPWGHDVLNLRKRFSWLNPNPYREDYKAYYSGKVECWPGPLKQVKKIKLQLRSTLYYLLLVIEMWWRWVNNVMPPLRRGRIVLADRYIYDILTGYKNQPMDYHTSIRKIICNCYPKADVGILLSGKPEMIIRRKSQLNLEQLQRAYAKYYEISKKYRFFLLGTSKDLEATLTEFENKILPKMLLNLSNKLKN